MNPNEQLARGYYALAATLRQKMQRCAFGAPEYWMLSEQHADVYKRGQEFERLYINEREKRNV